MPIFWPINHFRRKLIYNDVRNSKKQDLLAMFNLQKKTHQRVTGGKGVKNEKVFLGLFCWYNYNVTKFFEQIMTISFRFSKN
ncbi:hypothetical protein C7K43_12150 [Tetragenococcus koreensis]|nr:hypothetical protein C7K43_12150 [Tetragenococcus koreensis]